MDKSKKVAKCICGKKAYIMGRKGTHWVNCARMNPDCWIGPDRKTKYGAINAWNKLMALGK